MCRPSLLLRYKEYASRRHGYIDPTIPAAANHIVVGELGDDEVLLIACDNGSVIGFRTDPIADGFWQRENSPVPAFRELELKPFFVQEVGASACESSSLLPTAIILYFILMLDRGAGHTQDS